MTTRHLGRRTWAAKQATRSPGRNHATAAVNSPIYLPVKRGNHNIRGSKMCGNNTWLYLLSLGVSPEVRWPLGLHLLCKANICSQHGSGLSCP